MRADARRNRQQLLDATTELILEVGGAPSRDAIAQRAGVGIATLYRHFGDQQQLLRAVVLHVLDRTIEEGETALDESDTGGEALRRYLHAAIDAGLGAVNIVHPLLDDTDWPDRRAAARELLDRLINAARRDGAIDDGVTATDVALATIRFCRPFAIGLGPADERAIAHRQLDTHLDGLSADARWTHSRAEPTSLTSISMWGGQGIHCGPMYIELLCLIGRRAAPHPPRHHLRRTSP